MTQLQDIKNPKRPRKATGRDSWYPYYAGFSEEFVSSAIGCLAEENDTTILDPWNGSGTTTNQGNKLGYSTTGFDLNPVMVIAAKAKILAPSELSSIRPLAKDILSKARTGRQSRFPDTEPLETWFYTSSAQSFRQIERSLQKLLVDPNQHISLSNSASVNNLSSIACFFYVALFRTLRCLVSRFEASNPTWIKKPGLRSRLKTRQSSMLSVFLQEVNAMVDAANGEKPPFLHAPTAELLIGCSSALPVNNAVVDMVITSPPYCTRIDYAMATLPELTLLGYQLDTDFDVLRRSLIGSSTVSKEQIPVNEDWGINCNRFLEEVATHGSKASATYYYKNHIQYFDGIFKSVGELNRVIKPGGKCVIVVQDSYYKNIYNDLAQTFTEMFCAYDMPLIYRNDFISGVTMGGINQHHKKYGTTSKPIESILCFEK
ncbi:MAG: hypothetical protein ABWZ25_14180 [Chitinophagaceae bacterium]